MYEIILVWDFFFFPWKSTVKQTGKVSPNTFIYGNNHKHLLDITLLKLAVHCTNSDLLYFANVVAMWIKTQNWIISSSYIKSNRVKWLIGVIKAKQVKTKGHIIERFAFTCILFIYIHFIHVLSRKKFLLWYAWFQLYFWL